MSNPYYGSGAAEPPTYAESMESGLLPGPTTAEGPAKVPLLDGGVAPNPVPSAPVIPIENNNDNNENEEKICRICLDGDNEEDMIAPCLCAGGSKWVHRACLDQFRAANENNYRAISQCMTCNFQYSWVPREKEGTCCGWIKEPKWELRRRIATDVILVAFVWAVVVCGLAGLIYVADGDLTYPRSLAYAFLGLCAVFGVIAIIQGCIAAIRDDREPIDPCPCHCIYCGTIHCGDCNCNGGGNMSDGCAVALLIVLVVLAFVGFVYLISLSILVVAAEAKVHYQKYEREVTCKVYIVQDLRDLSPEDKRAISGRSYENQPLMADKSGF